MVNHSQNTAYFISSLNLSEFVKEEVCPQIDLFDFKMPEAHIL